MLFKLTDTCELLCFSQLLSSTGWYAELAALYKHYSKHEQVRAIAAVKTSRCVWLLVWAGAGIACPGRTYFCTKQCAVCVHSVLDLHQGLDGIKGPTHIPVQVSTKHMHAACSASGAGAAVSDLPGARRAASSCVWSCSR